MPLHWTRVLLTMMEFDGSKFSRFMTSLVEASSGHRQFLQSEEDTGRKCREQKQDPRIGIYAGNRSSVAWRRWSGGDATGPSTS